MRRSQILISLALLLLSARAFAQGGGNVAITGTVTDSTGALVPGAKVTVTQKNTSIARNATTDGAGQFNISSIPPATYTVLAEAQGFKRYAQEVVLLADQTRNMDIRLASRRNEPADYSGVIERSGEHRESGTQPGD